MGEEGRHTPHVRAGSERLRQSEAREDSIDGTLRHACAGLGSGSGRLGKNQAHAGSGSGTGKVASRLRLKFRFDKWIICNYITT